MGCFGYNNNRVNSCVSSGYVHQYDTWIGGGDPKTTAIGIGMWLGIIMAYNVWFVIWPNQKIALGIIESMKQLNQQQYAFSRTNTLLSFQCYFQW